MHVDSYSYKMKYYFRLASLKKIKRKENWHIGGELEYFFALFPCFIFLFYINL